MTVWSLEPRDPLLFRDGRPFSSTPGAVARSLTFPFPSTIAGALFVRVMARLKKDTPNEAVVADRAGIQKISVRGPLLGMQNEAADDNFEVLVPAPADCVFFPSHDKSLLVKQRCLTPQPITGKMMPLPEASMQPLAFDRPEKDKPVATPPRFWRWKHFADWLKNPQDACSVELKSIGIAGPLVEQRMHLQVRGESQTAEEGMLFQTRSLEFRTPTGSDKDLMSVRNLALLLETTAAFDEGLGVVGGERRLVRWRKQPAMNLPAPPEGLVEKIAASGACRLILLTPGAFDQGWRPGAYLEAKAREFNLKVTLGGAAVPRPQVVSGWVSTGNRAKPSRRLAPAGSVYFLHLEGAPADREAFLTALWVQNISDNEHDRRDGFGLCAFGVWCPAPDVREGATQ